MIRKGPSFSCYIQSIIYPGSHGTLFSSFNHGLWASFLETESHQNQNQEFIKDHNCLHAFEGGLVDYSEAEKRQQEISSIL